MELKQQVDHLDAVFLAAVSTEFPEPLSMGERAMVSSYLILSHAILEEALEDAFLEHFDGLIVADEGASVSMEVVRVAFAIGLDLQENEAPYSNRNLVGLLKGLGRRRVQTAIFANNGLKATNVKSLAKSVGLQWTNFEQALELELIALSTLGSKRGAASHLSPFSSKAVALDPSVRPDDVRIWVNDALKSVLRIRSELQRLRRSEEELSLIVDWDGN